jgi:hypothetical protein
MNPIQRRNRINGQFSPRLTEMLESPAYRALSCTGHMVISRIEIELSHHGGNDNGRLPVTTDDFMQYGMHRTSVAPAIREAEALGFIRVTVHGRGGNAEHRTSNLFMLTFGHGRDNRVTPTHEWRRIKTLEEAKLIARAARADKNPRAVAHGKMCWQKRKQNQKAGTENSPDSVQKNRIKSAKCQYGKPELHNWRKNRTTIYSSGRKSAATTILTSQRKHSFDRASAAEQGPSTGAKNCEI